jgi:dGTPase
MILREQLEEREELILSPRAARSAGSRGRLHPEDECSLRPAFQRDRDRILYSKTFRRLKHKTQVFLAPSGDHYRTRLTHTLEVSQIARTLARALHLNEDLTEAIALGHDLGHTPFGHAGEDVLRRLLPEGFRHHEQSLRVVDVLERDGRGLNLTFEVRMGILHHSKGRGGFLPHGRLNPDLTLESYLVRVSDVMAYIAHDVDDAVRGGVISESDLPRPVVAVLGDRLSRRIDTMVRDLVDRTTEADDGGIHMSPAVEEAMINLREYLYKNVYDNIEVHADFIKATRMLAEIFNRLMDDDHFFSARTGKEPPREEASRRLRAADYIAGMTDRYALELYAEDFMPSPWRGLG